jgi:hypothetical protein
MVVDVHAHFLPEISLEALRQGRERFPSVELIDDDGGPRLAFADKPPTRPIMA